MGPNDIKLKNPPLGVYKVVAFLKDVNAPSVLIKNTARWDETPMLKIDTSRQQSKTDEIVKKSPGVRPKKKKPSETSDMKWLPYK